jgi:hypothetical protein
MEAMKNYYESVMECSACKIGEKILKYVGGRLNKNVIILHPGKSC